MRRRYAVCLASIVLLMFAAGCVKETVDEPPSRSVAVKAGAISFVPNLPVGRRSELGAQMTAFLGTLYKRAFIRPRPAGPTPLPGTFSTVDALTPLFATPARPALRAHAGTFTLGPHLDLLNGVVAYSGGVTTQGKVTTALLNIRFDGSGSRADEATPVILVAQSGTMLLQHTEAGWFVREFDLKLRTKPAPTPTPT